MITLINKDSKGKIRVAEIQCAYDEELKGYLIKRTTYQYNGKKTAQPDILIQKGKASRTITEQAKLQCNSIIKGYLDKGYKQLKGTIDQYDITNLEKVVGSVVTGQNGVVKPMLAKKASDIKNKKIFDKLWFASRKINGLRCLIYLGDDGKLHTSSRGSINYDASLIEILTHPDLIKLFEDNPELIMDGEIFVAHMSLQNINSLARTQTKAIDYEILQFYWYDIVRTDLSFKDRFSIMNSIKDKLNLSFYPDRKFKQDELRIQFVPQIEISGWNNIMKLHNEYVSDGWEGVVIRDPDALYKPNSRGNQMIKIKQYLDETFKVIGYELGLRGSEDMCFIMEMPDGRTFKAKPMGTRELRENYVINFDSDYKNHLGDCKYFEYSDDGIPLQPHFVDFRWDLD